MKRLFQISCLAFALLLGILPLAACGANEEACVQVPSFESEEVETPSNEVRTEEPQSPEPEAPEESELPAEPEPPKTPKAQYVRVLTDNLNVRAGAGTSYKSLGQAEKGILLKYAGQTGSWYETRYRGTTAYVSAGSAYTELLELDESAEKIEAVIEEGLKFMGVPYVYGAVRLHDGKGNMMKNFTSAAFDCSSLMQYIFYKGAGVLLDVTTRTQIKQGVAVKKSDIQRGDLLFFTNASRYYNTGIERVGHVALYLGDNYILHTASDYAKVEQISAQRWKYFLEARRVL